VLPEPLIAMRQGDTEPVSKFPLVSKSPLTVSAVTDGLKIPREVKVEVINNPIIMSCIIFFGFILVSLRLLLRLGVSGLRFYLCIYVHLPLRSFVRQFSMAKFFLQWKRPGLLLFQRLSLTVIHFLDMRTCP
jgi:hypothetical protein